MLDHAAQLDPSVVGNCSYAHSHSAVRSIPRDGLPAIGYNDADIYTVVTHTGMTLAPIIGLRVATELSLGVSLELLDIYRLTRL